MQNVKNREMTMTGLGVSVATNESRLVRSERARAKHQGARERRKEWKGLCEQTTQFGHVDAQDYVFTYVNRGLHTVSTGTNARVM
jgi:hypothetical protein